MNYSHRRRRTLTTKRIVKKRRSSRTAIASRRHQCLASRTLLYSPGFRLVLIRKRKCDASSTIMTSTGNTPGDYQKIKRIRLD
jgi:hypothetical protein